jgi:hypothetical protein
VHVESRRRKFTLAPYNLAFAFVILLGGAVGGAGLRPSRYTLT